MNRTVINFVTDLLAALSMLGMIATGITLRYALPPGTNRSLSLWGLTRHQWGDLHFWLALSVLGVVLIHLALHWTWIVAVVRRWIVGRAHGGPSAAARSWAAVATVLLLALCLGGFWRLSIASVVPAASRSLVPGTNHRSDATADFIGERIRGSMSLAEAAAVLDCSTLEVRTQLGLREQTADSERLGQIAVRLGIDMQELRRILEAKRH